MEFGLIQISQIIENASKLFSMMDIMNCVEIWRSEHALGVLEIFSELFGDIDMPELSMDFGDALEDDTVDSDWMNIRDDSSAELLFLEECSFAETTYNSTELLCSSGGELLDVSAVIRNIAKEGTAINSNQEMEM